MIIIWYYLVVCVCFSDDLCHFTKEWVATRGEPGLYSYFSSTLLMLYLFTDTTAWNIISIISWDLLNSLFSSLHFSRSVVSDSLRPHELQDARPPCPSPTPWVYPNSCPLSRWCHLTISSSVIPFSSCPQFSPASRLVFSNKSALLIRWPKHWSFSFNISPSNEHPGLISFRMNWLDLLEVQGTLKSLLQHHSSKASILRHSNSLQSNSHIHTWPWKNHSLD